MPKLFLLRKVFLFIYLFAFFSITQLFAQSKCIDMGTGIGVSNDELAFINFFKDGGKWEPIGDNGHPWYKVYSLDTFKVVNGDYYNWDVDWSGTVNNEAWGSNWADCFINFLDMMKDQGKLRPDGYPTGFPTTVYKYKPKSSDPNQGVDPAKPVTITSFSRRIYFPTGLTQDGWVLRWKGKGKIRYQGMEVSSSSVPSSDVWNSWTPDGSYAGKDYTFTSTSGGRVVNKHFWMVHGWVLSILESDPADPIRDVEYLYPGQEASYDAGQRFTPLFLERMRQFKCLRYMGYLSSNGISSRKVMASGHPYENTDMMAWLRWDERTPDNYYQINNGNGGNYEAIIDLANQSGTDAWVNIPYCANEVYTDSLVRLFMAKLNPDRTLYLEVGNELWNYAAGFDGYHWQARMRVREYPGLGDVEGRGAFINRIFKQVTETAGPRNLPRIQRVFAGFPRYYDINNRTTKMIQPEYWDAFATTWYFSLDADNSSSNTCKDTQSATNWRSVLYNWYLAHPTDQAGFNQTYRNCILNEFRCKGSYRNNVDAVLAKYYNKKLVCYEGGNHTFYGCTNGPTGSALTGELEFNTPVYPDYYSNNGFVNAVCKADESTEIGEVFNEVIDSLQSAGVSLANHLSFSGRSTCYGVWDLIQSRDLESSLSTLLAKYGKFKAFSDRITSSNCNKVNITLASDTVGPGLSIMLDGINDYVEGKTTYIPDETGNYTMEVWVKPYYLDKDQVVLSFSSDGTNDNYNVIKVRADKKVVWEIGNNGTVAAKLVGIELETDKWYHIAASRNGVRYTLYVNGVSVANNNFSLTSSTRNRFTIGGLYKGSSCQDYLGGEIDEVRLWDVACSIDDIRALMCKKVQPGATQYVSLRSYYRFDRPDYASYTLYDQITKAQNGRLRNITITERSRYAVSGAALGDYSHFIYPATWSGASLSLTHPQGDKVAVYNVSGTVPAGVQLYMIDGQSHYNDLPTYYTDISNKRTVGVFMANGLAASYDVSYVYQGNPDASSGGGETNLRLLRRDDYSTESWLHAGARIDAVAKSLTVSCKEKYRAEYNLAHRPTLENIRPGSGKALLDNQVPTGNVMGKVQYLNMTDYTVTFWAKGWGEAYRFTSKLNANSHNFTINNNGTSSINCGIRHGVHWNYDISFTSTTIGTNTEWHHYAATKSGSKIRIYVDGMEVVSGDVTSTFSIQEMYLFNAPSWQAGNFQGGKANLTIDELAVFNTALDQATIRNWMCKKITADHPNECKNLVLYFNFDENQGTVLEDKRGPSDIVLTTDGGGFQWVTSGAAIGNESVADYASPDNVILTHPDGDFVEAVRTGGSSYGAHLYRVDNAAPEPSTTNSTSIKSLDSSRYEGLFVAKPVGSTPLYTFINHYEKNTRVLLANESQLRLLNRTDNSTAPWVANTAILPNTTLHTLSLTNQSGGEYILGGTDVNTFLENTPPVLPVFLPATSLINLKTICGNSTGLLYKVQSDPNVISYIWTLPAELNGYSISDSIYMNAAYNGTVSKKVVISVVAVNSYGQSAAATDTIILLPPPTVSDAGPDQILVPPTINTNMAANTPTGSEIATWYLTSGTGGITNSNDPVTAITALASGTNRFAWNIDNMACPLSTDTVRIIVAPSPVNILLQNGDPLPFIVCEGEVLTIKVVPAEDLIPNSYVWTMPSGITLINQTGLEAVIQIGSGIGGAIQVSAVYNGVSSLPFVSTPISINALPTKPVFTNSPATLCLNVDADVSIQYAANTDSVVWTLPYGIYPLVYPKSTTENITIQAIDVTSGYIKAQTYNSGCTNSTAIDSFSVIVEQAPAKPILYLGDDGNFADKVCENANALLWVKNVQANTTYEWKWNTGCDFVKYFNDNHSGALFNIYQNQGDIYVRAVQSTGTCNTSEWFDFYLWPQTQGPATVSSVVITTPSGQNALALQVGQTYTFTATGTATNYYWDIPVGFELVSDGNPADNICTLRVVSASAGYLNVYPVTLMGCSGTPFVLNIGVTGALLPPVFVSGTTEICQGTNLNITVSSIVGATGYIWTLPDGTVFNTTTPVLNQLINTPMKGLMSVVASNGTTQSEPMKVAIIVSPIFLTKTGFVDESNQPITELEVCSGASGLPIYHASNSATIYTWFIHGSAITFNPRYQAGHSGDTNYELLNRTSDQDTMMSISWESWRCKNNGSDGGFIVVSASNACGGGAVKDSIPYYWSQPLSILVPEYTKSPTNACVGSKVNFEINPIANATEYVWKLPNGLVASDVITTGPSITADVVNGTGGVVTVMAIGSTCGGSQTIEQPSDPITISGTAVDFHFISAPQAACPGDLLTFTVNNIGASSYLWTLPEGLGATQLDDQNATGVTITGSWSLVDRASMINGKIHTTSNDNASKVIKYVPDLPYTGKYKVSVSYYTDWNIRSDVPVTITSADGTSTQFVNMQVTPSNGIWQGIGEYNFNAGTSGSVAIGANASGGSLSVADAVKFEVVGITDDSTITIPAKQGLGGAVCVSVNIPQCSSEYTVCTDPINLAGTLDAPVYVAQENSVCEGLAYTFRANDIGADTYTWHLPAGMSIGGLTGGVSGLGREVSIKMESNTGAPVTIGVHGEITSCGILSDTTYTNPILFNGVGCKLTTPVFLLQPAGICIGSNATYSVTAIQYAENYQWVIPAGLQQIGTLATGTILTTSPSITLEPTGTPTGNLGTMYVKALSSVIVSSDSVVSTPITVSNIPVFTVAFTDITQCGTNDGSIRISGLIANSIYAVSYDLNALVTGPANRTTDATGMIVIPNLAIGSYGNVNVGLTGCSTTNPAAHTIITPVTALITGVIYHNPTICGGTGSIAIGLSGALPNAVYSIDYNNNGSADVTGTVINDTILLTGLPVGFTLNQLAIVDQTTHCSASSNTSGTIADPTLVTITGLVFQSTDTCGGDGTIHISMAGATNNALYSVDFENDGVANDTSLCVSNSLTLSNVSMSAVITNLAIKELSSGCNVVSGLSGKFIALPVVQIRGVDFVNATQCTGQGQIKVATLGASNSASYTLNLNNDAITEGRAIVINDTLTYLGIPIGTTVNGLTIQDIATRCTADSAAVGAILAPASPVITGATFIDPINCGDSGSIAISATGAAEGSLFNVDLNSDGSFMNSLVLTSGILTITSVAAGDSINGITITDASTLCSTTSAIAGGIHYPDLPDVSIADLGGICVNSPSQILQGGLPAGGSYSIDQSSDVTTEINPANLSIGTHWVFYRYSDSRNCTNSDSVEVTINGLPETAIVGDQSGCPQMQNAAYSTSFNASNQYNWAITNGTYNPGANSAQIVVNWTSNTSGEVQLIVVDNTTLCSDTSSLEVSFSDTESPVLAGCLTDYHVAALVDETGIYYVFGKADSVCIPKASDNCTIGVLNTTFSANNSTAHDLSEFSGFRFNKAEQNNLNWTITDNSGNTSECSVNILFDLDEIAPTAFSPNGDQHNDTWEIDYLIEFPECIVKVYNRLGMLVYQSEKGYPVNWDGKSNGKLVPLDTYYYVISPDNSKKVFKGYVTVIY